MFSPTDIQIRLHQKPFIPVRIITTSGQAFDIFHPDLVLVGLRDLTIGFASSENPAIYAHVTRVSLSHVTALEDLPAKSPPGANEQRS